MDFHNTIEKYFGEWRWLHLLLAVILGISLIWLIDPVLSKKAKAGEDYRSRHYGTTTRYILSRWLDRNDPRGFLKLNREGINQEIFDIAWVTGSSIAIHDAPPEWRLNGRSAYNLTEVLNKYVMRINKQPVAVQQYLLQGARAGDIRRAFISAANDPNTDLILMPINTVWVFNDWLTFTKTKQRSQFHDYPDLDSVDHRISRTVLSPFEIALNWLKDFNNSYALRTFISKNMKLDKLKRFMGGHEVEVAGTTLQNWRDWFYPKDILDSTADSIKQYAGYRAFMLMQNTSQHGLARQLFQANVKLAAQKNIPTIFYVAPIPLAAKEDETLMNFLDEMFAAMQEDIDKYGNENTTLVTSTAFGTPQPYLHRDILHLRHGQGLIDALMLVMEMKFDLKFTTIEKDKIYDQPQKPE